jgi:hypothetical protein
MLPEMRKRTRRTSCINNDRLVHRALLEGDDAIAIEFTCGGGTERDDIIENQYARARWHDAGERGSRPTEPGKSVALFCPLPCRSVTGEVPR